MKLKQFFRSKRAMFAFLSISLLLCMDVALGATLDVYVSDGGNAASQAYVYMDDNPTAVGTTEPDGWLRGINVSPGFHKVVAERGGNRGTNTFTANSDSYTSLNIYLT
jgi:hypothetical protein